jgi:EAL domain-containing protein (putative c-di-GMP-specific phosphodiesterase class I)
MSPAYFIPIAEEIGIIAEIDHWVLRTACAQLAEWRKLPRIGADLRVSVNLSSHQLSLENIHQHIEEVLADFHLPASALCLEVTETVLMNDVDTGIEVLRALRSLGVGLHMDDFGSGYSSFKHLYQLPFDTLKIDRTFSANILADKHARKIVKAILNLAETLHLHIIAEGIEDAAQAILLCEMGCIAGQGYYFSRPVDPVIFRERFLAAASSQESSNPENFPQMFPALLREAR